MSCQIETIGDCVDIERVARSLYLPERNEPNWINNCLISLSSCGTILVISYKNRVCLCTAQWINSSESNTYIVTWNGTLPCDITAVLASPICSIGHSAQDGPDWICIMVGQKNGDVSFYTDAGHLLLTEKHDASPVKKISCHTGSFGSDADDIHIFYSTSITVLSGPSLFQTLRYAKTQLARVQAGVTKDYYVDGKSIISRKWSFADQDVINDGAVVGLELKNTYDHLLAASNYGGYDTWYRSVPPHNTLVLGAGARPYLGFHYALEGGITPPLQDVARAVASKFISALPGWLGGGTVASNASKAEESSRARAESLVLRSAFCDTARHAHNLALSPDRRLAAIPDNLGRVSLLDIHKGILIRIFKGYREAQCAFVQVFEEDKRAPSRTVAKEKRRATFLIIYTPKKGLIDIRLMQKGSRIAVFTAAKNGRLLYNTHGMLGTEASYTSKKLNMAQFPCVLMDYDGKLKKFIIPFHYALEGENSDRSRDLHMIKKLKEYIKEESFDEASIVAEVVRTATSIKTSDMKKHCLDFLVGCKVLPPHCILAYVQTITDEFKNVDDVPQKQAKLYNYCVHLRSITKFFMHINSIHFVDSSCSCLVEDGTISAKSENIEDQAIEPTVEENTTISEKPSSQDERLLLPEADIINLTRLLDLTKHTIAHNVPLKVSFEDHKMSLFKEFVSSFDIDGVQDFIKLKPKIVQSRLGALSQDMFRKLFAKNTFNTKEWGKFVKCGNLCPTDLAKLLIAYWMEIPFADINIETIDRFKVILYEICLVSHNSAQVSYNEISPWWQDIRNILVDMPCTLRSMIVAVVCRVIGQAIEKDSENNGDEEAWVSLSKETAKWSLLIGKLEDISLLSIVLLFKYNIKGETLPKLNMGVPQINLKYIYNRGKGCVSELISKWLCCIGVLPHIIMVNEHRMRENIEDKKKPELDDELECVDEIALERENQYIKENEELFTWLNLLRKQFPYSTSSDNLVTNMCWEYACAWQKEIDDLSKFNAILLCLNNIENFHLSTGLCTLLWMTYIKNTFDSTCRLVNKVGKLPKERLCRQDVGLSDTKMVQFMNLVTQFLDRFILCASMAEKNEKPILIFENIWDKSVPALIEVAQENADNINIDALCLVYQISATIHYQCHFNIKVPKVLTSLFDCDLQYVLSGITANNEFISSVNLRTSQMKLRTPRLKFINKLIMAALELISTDDSDGEGQVRYHVTEMSSWLDKVHNLAQLWDIDSDFIRRDQVVGLYKLGFDSLAEELIPQVSEPELMLEGVMNQCGKRLKRHIETSDDISNDLVALPPQLGVLIQTLESDTTLSASISIKSTRRVLDCLLNSIDTTRLNNQQQHQIKMSEMLLEGCDILQELRS